MHHPAPKAPGTTEGPGPLSRLERTVLTALLDGDDAGFAVLRTQLARASVISRTHSGVGFVTRFEVPGDIPALADGPAPRLRPITAVHPLLSEAAEFLLQLRAGRLAVLEAFCFDGAWPADEAGFRVVV